MTKAKDIDNYIAAFPAETRKLLGQIRSTIHKAAPGAKETISYAIPAFRQHQVLVYFAGYAQHIGFYPTSSGIRAFREQLSSYKSSKGAVQFPLDEPLPVKLITEIVKFRLQQDEEYAAMKTAKNASSQDQFATLSAPARRALINAGIRTPAQLAKLSGTDILSIHGIGKSTLPLLHKLLEQAGLRFKNGESSTARH